MTEKLIEATSKYYNLPNELVCDHLSQAVSDYFTCLFHKLVICTIEDSKLKAYFFDDKPNRNISIEITQRDKPEIMKRYKMLLDISDSYRRYYEHFNYCHMAIVEGERIGAESVQISGLEGVIGLCLKRDMGTPLPKGTKALFYVKRISLSRVDTRVRCVLHLSRTAKELPVKVTESIVKNPLLKLHCYKRVPGEISLIYTNYYMKKKYITQINEMLSERVIFRKFSL